MKKIIFAAFALTAAMLTASCTNEDIEMRTENKNNEVALSVSLSNFYQNYNYTDTWHNIRQLTDEYRTFSSENDYFIQVRTLFYDSRGNLTDSVVSYSTNTNEVNTTLKLAEGEYTVVSTLVFAYQDKNDDYQTYWQLEGKDKLSTSTLTLDRIGSKWLLMSYDAKTLSVRPGETAKASMKPSPIGALGYRYLQNFQYRNEADLENGTKADNSIRQIALYCRNMAMGYKLDPNSTEKYVYRDDNGRNMWYYLSLNTKPTDINSAWTYFETNLYGYFYCLSPQMDIYFGYVVNGKTTFEGYGQQLGYRFENGKTYLAYWDYLRVGEPYFGPADNAHWHSYDSARAWTTRSQECNEADNQQTRP